VPRLRSGAPRPRHPRRRPGAGAATAGVTLRQRAGKLSAIDGPFAETKEILGGFQLWETRDLAEAVELAKHIPWTRVGSVEVRAIGAFGVVPEYP
jgi:hypothetical protein